MSKIQEIKDEIVYRIRNVKSVKELKTNSWIVTFNNNEDILGAIEILEWFNFTLSWVTHNKIIAKLKKGGEQ